ncbi:hypothetical protein PF005_g986 [Phytophthora fragariae]|uniref:Uncharacterized protein n=2 Tax=Phytophthora TaxID=4783 RepID=A0A6A4EC67_9STRA|nr:hypothetical protein PF003_g1460 [Phytophthora fragariae]KAE9034984.1 hypothetical protein PR002_g7838 [Phytophthora rubi]KAE8944979.1 hypothetical protein PF009_g5360 [Phytophthora fragariae]KAE9021420.1 hypothetical protein PF011_g4958 [Phytophthora fragariae]KAE9050309.1 hypothetical protein PR001_g2521 [Phytophthora rubi]
MPMQVSTEVTTTQKCRRIMIKFKLLRSVNIPFRQIAAHLVCLAAYQGSLDGLSKIYWIKARGKSF